jgi:hypothetical protein
LTKVPLRGTIRPRRRAVSGLPARFFGQEDMT